MCTVALSIKSKAPQRHFERRKNSINRVWSDGYKGLWAIFIYIDYMCEIRALQKVIKPLIQEYSLEKLDKPNISY